MSIKVAHSRRAALDQAISELRGGLERDASPKAIIYFASSVFDPHALAAGMQAAFPSASCFGCSTAGEIVSGCMLDKSIVAMALDGDVVEGVSVEVLANLSADAVGAVDKAFAGFAAASGAMASLDPAKFVGIVLADGLAGAEEKLMDRIGDLTNVTFIGGSAGDDLKFRGTWVFAHGKAHSDAAVLALLKTARPFEILKTQSFDVLDRRLVATKVNPAAREVIEFDGKPAALAYADAVGATRESAPDFFMKRPLGLMVGAEPYVRSPQRIEGTSVFFYCNIAEGMELAVLQSRDIVQETGAALAAKLGAMGRISGILNFHCILRTLELKSKQQTEAYGRLFSKVPTIGFSTYGEAYIGHMNQTSTMLLFT